MPSGKLIETVDDRRKRRRGRSRRRVFRHAKAGREHARVEGRVVVDGFAAIKEYPAVGPVKRFLPMRRHDMRARHCL